MAQAFQLFTDFVEEIDNTQRFCCSCQNNQILQNLKKIYKLGVHHFNLLDLFVAPHPTYKKLCSNGLCSEQWCDRVKAHPPVYKITTPIYSELKLRFDIKKQKQMFIQKINLEVNSDYFSSFNDKCVLWWNLIKINNKLETTKIYYENNKSETDHQKLLYKINNNIGLTIVKNNTCLCQICILDTLPCHCISCVIKEFLFTNYPTKQCPFLNLWKKKFLNFLNFCCCTFHSCSHNNSPCYCKKCSFRIDGCICIRCTSYDTKIDLTCSHIDKFEKCKDEIVLNWLNQTYYELFKTFYPSVYEKPAVS